MEACCLLCLKVRNNENDIDVIKADSTSWQELNVKEILEKHFWPLNGILQISSSWLCLTCWHEVKDFHEFYVSIEKAHQNANKLKAIKQELTSFGYLEPEIVLNERVNSLSNIDIKAELPLDEPNLEYVSLNQIQSSPNLVKDPLEKTDHETEIKEKFLKDKEYTKNNLDIKLEPDECTEFHKSNNSDSYVDNTDQDGDCSDDSVPAKRPRIYIKRGKNYRENDHFIMKHFKQMFCDLCQIQFEDFSDMQKHFSDVHKQVGYLVCCSRKFYTRNRLVDHIHVHLNPEHFKCDQCGKVLSDRVKLKTHILGVHQPNDVDLKHSCDICGKSFVKSYVLQNHKMTHLSEEEKKFHCSDCGKKYASFTSLKLHREVLHLNKLAKICYICGLTLRTNTEYKAHMNKHEGITTNMNCDICGLRITSERGLKLHKESQHPVGGKQEHKCTLCPKISPTLRALKKHFNTMHVQGYEHKCTLCEKAFKRLDHLKEHIASHTGTALYTCPWCPKTFNSNSNMYAHRKKMHPKEWKESKLQKYTGTESVDT